MPYDIELALWFVALVIELTEGQIDMGYQATVIFSDSPMEGPPGGLLCNGEPINDADLETYYHQSCEDEPWYECDAFLEHLEKDGFTHVEGTWEGASRLHRLSDMKPEPLFRDYKPNESIWMIFEDGTKIPAIASEPPGDQTVYTFEPDGARWPWSPDDTDPDNGPASYIMAGSDGLFEEEMDPMGPYPDVYGTMMWTWEHEGIIFTTRPREKE